MYTTNNLSHKDAMKMINAVAAELDKNKKGAAVAVTDSHGELIAFLKTDGCRFSSITIAINKSYTASREQKESKEVGKSSAKDGFPMTNFGELKYVTWGGGVPVFYKNELIGAIGISGMSEKEDMKLARWAVGLLELE